MDTRIKKFGADVRGEWKNADPMGFGCIGHWCWEEAEKKLLAEFDGWKNGEKVMSIKFHRWTGIDIQAGASLKLEIIYEALS